MDIEEVLVARIVSSGQTSSNSLKICNFKSKFSVAASITKLAYCVPSFIEVYVVILARVLSLSSLDIFSLTTILLRFLLIAAIALSREF